MKPGDRVRWVSQSRGSWKLKRGIVVNIIEPGEDARKLLPPDLEKSLFKGIPISQRRRALVVVWRGRPGRSPYYAPPINWLEKE